MKVFILNSGRCGSTTFIQACRHITNFTAGHETRVRLIGAARLAYPDQHIEADNRLAWMLGRLDRVHGDNARYVHLRRDPLTTAASFARRAAFGIMKAYREGILLEGEPGQSAEEIALDYLDTVEANIDLFLRDKQQRMDFRLEHAKRDFRAFWAWIGAQGDLEQALAEWDRRHNASAAWAEGGAPPAGDTPA
ncbi:MAG: hypothetical protein MUC79_02680 [Thiobacillaceae bacterium]|jgi:hypothetical protein|nr:hypothetical protein [Thiobacillaceae bacterium]